MRRIFLWLALGSSIAACATTSTPTAATSNVSTLNSADVMADQWPIEELPSDGLALGGFATGSAAKLTDLREMLLRYDGTFLEGWRTVLEDEKAPAAELHGALMELMTSVTGPGGLWRETIPNRWLGCKSDPSTEACKAFTQAATHFKKWDAFAEKLERAPANPKRFLVKSHGKILAYVQTYVPMVKSISGVKATPFFQDHLAATLKDF